MSDSESFRPSTPELQPQDRCPVSSKAFPWSQTAGFASDALPHLVLPSPAIESGNFSPTSSTSSTSSSPSTPSASGDDVALAPLLLDPTESGAARGRAHSTASSILTVTSMPRPRRSTETRNPQAMMRQAKDRTRVDAGIMPHLRGRNTLRETGPGRMSSSSPVTRRSLLKDHLLHVPRTGPWLAAEQTLDTFEGEMLGRKASALCKGRTALSFYREFFGEDDARRTSGKEVCSRADAEQWLQKIDWPTLGETTDDGRGVRTLSRNRLALAVVEDMSEQTSIPQSQILEVIQAHAYHTRNGRRRSLNPGRLANWMDWSHLASILLRGVCDFRESRGTCHGPDGRVSQRPTRAAINGCRDHYVDMLGDGPDARGHSTNRPRSRRLIHLDGREVQVDAVCLLARDEAEGSALSRDCGSCSTGQNSPCASEQEGVVPTSSSRRRRRRRRGRATAILASVFCWRREPKYRGGPGIQEKAHSTTPHDRHDRHAVSSRSHRSGVRRDGPATAPPQREATASAAAAGPGPRLSGCAPGERDSVRSNSSEAMASLVEQETLSPSMLKTRRTRAPTTPSRAASDPFVDMPGQSADCLTALHGAMGSGVMVERYPRVHVGLPQQQRRAGSRFREHLAGDGGSERSCQTTPTAASSRHGESTKTAAPSPNGPTYRRFLID